MKLVGIKRFPWLSLTLLMVAYGSFGWFLSNPQTSSQFAWFVALGWAWIISEVFLDPITDFSRFIMRWFKSDTVAFLSICMIAGLAAVIMFWLHVFLYIVTILATEALARIDLNTINCSRRQTLWILSSVSIVGLLIGGISRRLWHYPGVLDNFHEFWHVLPFAS